MSDPKTISPLLDGFTLGPPMSEHDGVRCCPAIKENSDKKYIVKILSIPASQTQMDALLLAGAYRDPADAMEYFRQLGEDVMKEAELLKTLSSAGGFLSYEGWQMEPITKSRLGYEVYLVSSYKRSLEKYVRGNPVTHLEAMNLGLDLCEALSVCRQAGALYVDLKPSNVFLSAKKEYRIADLGFVSLDALSYTVLPDKYRSRYTPPELFDPMSTLNLTADTYAVGMILYQLYNDGQLPFRDKAPETALPSPVNADYELAEVIMKAVHPDPAQRWQDPTDLRRALVEYMQRNAVNDVPITPHTPLEISPDAPILDEFRKESSQAPAQTDAPQESAPAKAAAEEPSAQEPPGAAEAPTDTDAPEAPLDAEPGPRDVPEPEVSSSAPQDIPQPPPPPEDETLPDEADADALQPHEMSDELSRIIAKADDLISHEAPGGVVVPEVPDLPDPFAFALEDELDDSGVPLDPVMEDPEPKPEETKKQKKAKKKFVSQAGKRKVKKILSTMLTLLVLAGLCFGAYWLYQNYYLQSIDSISIEGDRNQLTVSITSQVDNSLLTLTCSDNYGNVISQKPVENKAVFTGLLPNTMYRISVQIDGFHKLVGQTSEVFTTETTTSIVSFTAVTGQEDGSVMLNFTVDGEEPEEWTVHYQTEGEESQSRTFSGHTVTIDGLSIGKVYTFTLDAGEDLSLSGTTSLEYMATRLILAQNLTITSNGGSDLTIHWNSPGDIVVDSWTVRCYNTSGYEVQMTVHDTEVFLTDIDPTVSYTVEVTAAGMTQPSRASITANPVCITAFHVDDSDPSALEVRWEYTGNAPVGGWLLMYTVDGSDSQDVIRCEEASAKITPQIPGAKYQFTVQAADAISIFNNVQAYETSERPDFEANGLTAADITASLVKTPEEKNWRFDSLGSEAITDTFASGSSISIVLQAANSFYLPGTRMEALYVIEDADGSILPELISQEEVVWKDIWYAGEVRYGELDLPTAPTAAGDYILRLYLDGAKVAELNFTITN